jgi:hypothetical protein
LLISYLDILSTDESGVLRSPILSLSGPICSFMLRGINLMNLRAPMFCAYTFRTVITAWWIVPFIRI